MIIYQYDGTFDGMLTAVFDAFDRKVFPDVLMKEGGTLPLFHEELYAVQTSEEKAQRVWRGLEKKLSAAALSCLTQCWLSELPEVATTAFHYIRKTFVSGRSIETNFADPDVLLLAKIWKKVDWERIRLMQFVRFQKAADNTYFAAVEPQFNALPLVVSHFQDRFADQAWIIYDLRRRYGYYYDKHTVAEVTFDDGSQGSHLVTGMLDHSLMHEEECLYQRLWQTYFKATCIRERLNPRKHRQDMPVRYWKYLTEKRPPHLHTDANK